MTTSGAPAREIQALRERVSALSAAILRISASLDVTTVLQEAVDSARALTGARYGLITTVDDSGTVMEFVSSGFTKEELQQLTEWPEGPKLFAHFRDLPGPIRLTNLPDFVQSLGFSPDLMRSNTFQGTPMRHRGADVGNFFLAEKEGAPAFTDEDEEVLVLFASQAATAIVNARTHRDEQRARADLEALVETSPVGVVVFNAQTGRAVLVNREARRIVERLRMPGRPVEDLLGVITFRRADGREVSLSEFSFAQQLRIGETVRAEEIVLSVPDGRSVSMLVNGTPIHAEDGTVASMVVTMQDLAPLKELERLRADFLGMVSHELRAPLTAIKGSAATLLEEASELDVAEMHEFHRIIHEQAGHMRGLIGALLDAGRIEAGTLSVSPETLRGGGAGGPGSEHVPLGWRSAHGAHGPARRPARGDGRPPARRAGAEQPAVQRRSAVSGSQRRSGFRPRATGCTSRSRLPTRAGASRPSSCPISSASTPAPAARARRREPASGWSSARGWWRRTAAASGRRAMAPARAAASRSRCRWSMTFR